MPVMRLGASQLLAKINIADDAGPLPKMNFSRFSL
jgi:hypothetical protein